MTRWIPCSIGLVCAAAVGAAITAGTASAQGVNPIDNPGGLLEQGAKMAPPMGGNHAPLPPALPGAARRPGGAAPATQIPSDMSPNAALFDAINRGDLDAARDAMSRGADLDARNALGMTPMELSVDLGRNDISFVLLSYRGSESSGSPPAQATAAATPAIAPRAGHAGAKSSRVATHLIRTASRGRVPVTRADPPAASQAPRLFANDGGAPVPSSGFLGFGSGSTR
jgi:hypothetical protein